MTMTISHKKMRECSAILLVLLAVVGLLWKVGIYIPLISTVVITIVQIPALTASKWIVRDTPFLAYLDAFQGHIVWCVSASWLGIAGWLWSSRENSDEGFFEIFVYYGIFMALMVSSAVFAIAYNLDPFFNIRFYSSSFALSLALSFLMGKSWLMVQELSRKDR